MTIAILGGTGFIGRAVADRAGRRGLKPIVLARGQHPLDLPSGAIFEAVDRMDRDGLLAALRKHRVDTVIDISLSGAAIELAVRPAMGTPVTLGRMRARVVRHFQDGVAVEFASAQEMLTVVQQNLRIN